MGIGQGLTSTASPLTCRVKTIIPTVAGIKRLINQSPGLSYEDLWGAFSEAGAPRWTRDLVERAIDDLGEDGSIQISFGCSLRFWPPTPAEKTVRGVEHDAA